MSFRIVEKDSFKFEVNHTLCGTLAYIFYVDGEQIYKNNDYNPSPQALNNDEIMFDELRNLILRDEHRDYWSFPSEKKFIKSDRFKQFKALDKSI